MRATVGKMIGSLGSGFWGQVHDFTPDDPEKAEKKGRLVAAVCVNMGDEVDQVELVKTGREILGRLHELYFGYAEANPMESLKRAVEGVREEFGPVDIAGVVLLGEVVYVGAGGRVKVWAKIKEKQSFLADPAEGDEGVKMLSGKFRPGMCLVLGNEVFWEEWEKKDLGAVAEAAAKDMDEALEMLTATMGRGGEGSVAVVVYSAGPAAEMKQEAITVTAEEKPPQESVKAEKPKWLTKFSGKWSDFWQRVYVRRGDRDEQRKKMRRLGIGFLVLLLVMASAGQLLSRKKSNQQGQRNEQIEQIAADFRDATGMVDLNPARSKQILEQIKGQLEAYKGEKKPDPRISEILAGWDEVWKRASGIVEAEQTELIDLNLVREGMAAGGLAWSDGKLYVLDIQGSRVVEVDVTKGAGKVVGGGDSLTGARLIAGYPGRVMVLAQKGVMELGVAEPRIKTEGNWEKIAGMKIFSGNVYLLDPGSGEIWRYGVSGQTYGSRQKWLAASEDRKVIEGSLGMAIDGSIWLVKADGIVKYTRGIRDGFEITGLDKPWGENAKIYTSDETEKLYILDPANTRVVVLGKDGKYVKQYENKSWDKAVDLAADEKAGQIFLAVDGKVWSIKL